VNRGIDD